MAKAVAGSHGWIEGLINKDECETYPIHFYFTPHMELFYSGYIPFISCLIRSWLATEHNIALVITSG